MSYLNQKQAILILLLLIIFSFYSNITAAEIEDPAGRNLELPEKIEKIVAVGPGALRLLVYLEAEEMVVGIEEFEKRNPVRPYLLARPELLKLPVIGPQFGGDAELIAAREPDLIIASYLSSAELNNLQNKTKTPVVSINDGSPGSMTEQDFKKALNFLAGVLKREKRAADLIDFMEAKKAELKEMAETAEVSKTVYIGGIGNKGAQGITSTEAAYPPFKYLGLKNIIEEDGKSNFTISKERLLLEDPELIFVDQGGLELVENDLKREEFKYLPAYQNDNIYQLLPYNHYTTNFATMLADAYYIAKIVYGAELNELEPAKKADQIYQNFVGQPVYSRMANIFGGFKRMNKNDLK